MAQYDSNSNYDSFNVGFAPVARRPIIRKNLDAFASAFDKIGNAHMEALKQRSAIDVALAQVELDSSEDEWKADYVQKIKDRIDNAAMFGSYSSALTVATKAAADAVSSPELIGRQRAHQDHKKMVEEVAHMDNVDQEIKDYWNDDNQYHYEDKRDASGRIIGGSVWKPKWTPVKRVGLSEIAMQAERMVSEYQNSTSTETQSSVGNADGSGSGSLKSDSYMVRSKSKERILRMIDVLWNENNDARLYLQQSYNAKRHKIKKIEEELTTATGEERTRLQYSLADAKRGLMNETKTGYMSPEEWMLHQVNPMAAEMAYNNVSTDTKRHSSSQAASLGGSGGSGGRGSYTSGGGGLDTLLGAMMGGSTFTGNPGVVTLNPQKLLNAASVYIDAINSIDNNR